jgi:hypothetical protein
MMLNTSSRRLGYTAILYVFAKLDLNVIGGDQKLLAELHDSTISFGTLAVLGVNKCKSDNLKLNIVISSDRRNNFFSPLLIPNLKDMHCDCRLVPHRQLSQYASRN